MNLEEAIKELSNLKLDSLTTDRRIESLKQENLKLKRENTKLKEKIIEEHGKRTQEEIEEEQMRNE